MKKINKTIMVLVTIFTFCLTKNVFAEECVTSVGMQKYNVIFNTNGGNTIENMSICSTCGSSEVGKAEALAVIPTRKGYTFDGWYADSELTIKVTDWSKVNIITEKDSNGCPLDTMKVNLYAKWEQASGSTSADDYELNAYLVLVIDEDTKKEIKICGPDNCSVANAITENIKKINLPIPEKEGYKFEGWYLDDDYKVKVNDTKEFSKAIEKMKTTETGAVAEDDTSGVSMSISGSGNLEKQSEKISYKLYAKWTKDEKQVVKTGNTGMNSGMLFTIIGILMISAGSVVIYKKTRNNN